VVVCCLWATTASGQLLVHDAVSNVNHTITATQTFITAAQSILLVADSALNLETLNDIGITHLGDDLGEINGTVEEFRQLLYDLQYLAREIPRLFGLEGAPDTSFGLDERLAEIRAFRNRAQQAAVQVQTLWRVIGRTVERLHAIAGAILKILGNKQGQQQLARPLLELNMLVARQGVAESAFHQAQLYDQLEQTLIDESTRRITTIIYSRLPRRR
jgi:hypothetical protein